MRRAGFTLIELLLVVAVMALLTAGLLAALSSVRANSRRAACVSNIRNLVQAQQSYFSLHENRLITAGNGTEADPASWLSQLKGLGVSAADRRCADDVSDLFDAPAPPVRVTSYALNNHVSPTHAAFGGAVRKLVIEVKRPSAVIQFGELAESGAYAAADHFHVQQFTLAAVPTPAVTLQRIKLQMPLGRHGGGPEWDAVLNYGFLDGHAESLPLRDVYESKTRNRFDPDLNP